MRTHRQTKRRIPEAARKQNFIGIRITEAELSALQDLAERECVSLAYIVREGIKMVIEKRLRS